MRKPDFIGIGGQRCGTSSLYELLTSSPGIVPNKGGKELHFLDYKYSKGISWYLDQFDVGPGNLTGEISPTYMWHSGVLKRLQEYGLTEDILFIAMLRDPVERAWSHMCWDWKGEKSLDYALYKNITGHEYNILDGDFTNNPSEENRLEFYLCSLRYRGLYAQHLRPWFKIVGSENMLVLKSEDFFDNVIRITNEVRQALGLSGWTCYNGDTVETSVMTAPRKPPMPPRVRQELEDFFWEPNKELEQMLGISWS